MENDVFIILLDCIRKMEPNKGSNFILKCQLVKYSPHEVRRRNRDAVTSAESQHCLLAEMFLCRAHSQR